MIREILKKIKKAPSSKIDLKEAKLRLKAANNFWAQLPRPILAQAPLAGFTDSPFRQIVASFGAMVTYSEMISAAALFYDSAETYRLLKFSPKKEGHYVVQLFGAEPEHFAVASRLVTEKIKPAGIDINFGCPVPKVTKQGAGAALMADLPRARAVVEAVLANTDLPVSIKIRSASGAVGAKDFLAYLKDLPIAALMIHGRTRKQGFAGPVDVATIKEAVANFSGPVLANGGVNSLAEANHLLEVSGAAGLGLGRGSLGRPWLFREIINQKEEKFSWPEIASLMLTQGRLTEKLKGSEAFLELRKQLCYYVQGLPDASSIRSAVVKIKNYFDLKNILEPVIKKKNPL
ncbi:tRNA-dihydrouridine synthase family protein [Candidatus Falkowbacteria bacterium]|jgi:nifR3 family TIM-barrel protein|nr:tRNA-dihydrouridine synthase family protein [Patescibacteria group bacterium]NCU42786.1 tRNA-dihydrouridine synthase family protein [Candidatus Falkowbacteria bacterium]